MRMYSTIFCRALFEYFKMNLEITLNPKFLILNPTFLRPWKNASYEEIIFRNFSHQIESLI